MVLRTSLWSPSLCGGWLHLAAFHESVNFYHPRRNKQRQSSFYFSFLSRLSWQTWDIWLKTVSRKEERLSDKEKKTNQWFWFESMQTWQITVRRRLLTEETKVFASQYRIIQIRDGTFKEAPDWGVWGVVRLVHRLLVKANEEALPQHATEHRSEGRYWLEE